MFTMLLTAMSVVRVAERLELGIDSLLSSRGEDAVESADVAVSHLGGEIHYDGVGGSAGGGGGGGKGLAAGSSSRARRLEIGATCRRRVRVWPRQRRLGWR